jgi:hypothetical protein
MMKQEIQKEEIQLDVEQLEERIAPSAMKASPETRVMGSKATKASPETKAAETTTHNPATLTQQGHCCCAVALLA